MQSQIQTPSPQSHPTGDDRFAEPGPEKAVHKIEAAAKTGRPPGPAGGLLFGSLHEIQDTPVSFLADCVRRYGDISYFRMVFVHAYFVAHPDYIRRVLHDNHRNYDKQNLDYALLRRVLGNGLLTSEGEFWHRQRRLMAPMFHRQRVAAFGQLMTDATLTMLKHWEVLAEQARPFDVAAEMTRLTLEIVSRALFSTEVSSDAQTISRALTVVNEQMADFSLLDLVPIIPTPRRLRFNAAVRTLDAVVKKIISKRRSSKEVRQEDLLAMLLAARDDGSGKGMSDRQVRDEVMTLLLAGHETTANALSWTWYLLSQNPEAEDKLHRELADVLGRRLPTTDDLPRLGFTRMVIEESMRLYPPAWAISRNAIGDDEIGGYRIPKGSTVLMSSFITHRHPAFWDEPDRFEPERFTPERAAQRPPYLYFPFGGGPRICLGNAFAMTEAQLVLATVGQRYRLRLAAGHQVELQPLVTLRPRHGMKMTAHRLDDAAAISGST